MQTTKPTTKLTITSYCYYEKYFSETLVINFFTYENDNDKIKDRKIFTCRVETRRKGITFGAVAAMTWMKDNNERRCNLLLDDYNVVKEIRKQWKKPRQQSKIRKQWKKPQQ